MLDIDVRYAKRKTITLGQTKLYFLHVKVHVFGSSSKHSTNKNKKITGIKCYSELVGQISGNACLGQISGD